MNIWNRLTSLFRYRSRTRAVAPRGYQALAELQPRDYYNLLAWYYNSNNLYDVLTQELRALGIFHEGMKPLRNPAFRVVEFYAAKLWGSDELQVISDNPKLADPIKRVWQWSNWKSQQQVFARWDATYGNVFTKVAQSEDTLRVYFQNIEPQYVNGDYKLDERGFLTYIRIDIPIEPNVEKIQRDVNGNVSTTPILKWMTRTEVWDKVGGTYRLWESHPHADAPLEKLPKPDVEKPITAFGNNFIPIVHTKLRDNGDKRGVGAFVNALDKIDEANLMATRLHQMAFRNNRNTWALEANSVALDGRPLPPPNVNVNETDDTRSRDPLYELGDDKMVKLPGNSKLVPLVPALDYKGMLAILQDMTAEIEKDLPELAYYNIREKRTLSGVAVRLELGDAIDRALEARGNAEAALARLDAMALTIGANAGLKEFAGLGNYENGDFDHTFKKRDIIATDELEIAQTLMAATGSGMPLVTAMRRNNFTQEEIDQMHKDQDEENARNLAHATDVMNATQPQLPPTIPNRQPPQLQRAGAGGN